MAQVVLRVFSIFCNFGGPFIAPFIIPIINPVLIVSCFIPIMLIIMLTSINKLNSSDNTTKDWSKGSKWAFLIYYLIFLLISCSIMQTACRVGQSTGLV